MAWTLLRAIDSFKLLANIWLYFIANLILMQVSDLS
jgi:hypothetical protein